jgi:nicotinamide-nucleotide amidase
MTETSDERLEAQVGALLLAKGWTMSAAESCTGGLVLHRLTNIPGSSRYVLGGVTAYSNAIKEAILNIQASVLIEHGAVSAQVAEDMAINVRALFGSDIAVSVTGIAGPDGGTAEKPVGLTYIGLAGPDGLLITQRHVWPGDRETNKALSADAALKLILDTFAGK